MKNEDNNKEEEKFTYLPFLKIKLKDNLSFENNIRQNSNEIQNETYRLIDSYEIYKIRREINHNESLKSDINEESKILIRKKYNNLFNIKKKLNRSNNINKIRKINDNEYSSIKAKYLGLIKKYQFKNILRKLSHFDETDNTNSISLSNTNKTGNYKINKNTFSNQIINSNNNDECFTENQFNNTNSKIFQIEKTLYETKLSSKNIIKNIKNYSDKEKNKEQKIKNCLNKSAKSLKKFEKLMFDKNKKEEKKIKKISKINYYKLFEPIKKVKSFPIKKIKLSKKRDSNQIWIKRSTANLLIFGQSFGLMDDNKFFKYRKKILEDYPILEKDANIIKAKYINKDKPIYPNGNIEKNNKIIDGLFEKNKILYCNLYRKVNEIL